MFLWQWCFGWYFIGAQKVDLRLGWVLVIMKESQECKSFEVVSHVWPKVQDEAVVISDKIE